MSNHTVLHYAHINSKHAQLLTQASIIIPLHQSALASAHTSEVV